jgi:hypothetical protein
MIIFRALRKTRSEGDIREAIEGIPRGVPLLLVNARVLQLQRPESPWLFIEAYLPQRKRN